ncbi:MAG TPA: hypothetical protein VKU80_05370 [Planctomycetota bacterium]|nr:hypothetical protein [Planctomycetota bacterium]
MDLQRAYRRWQWKRLAFLLPSFGASLGVVFWLALALACPFSIRIPCLSLAVLLSALLGYLVLLTLACPGSRSEIPLQHARALRQQLSPWGPLCAFSLLCLIALVLVPYCVAPMPPSIPTSPALVCRICPPEPVPAPKSPAISKVESPVVEAPPILERESPAPLPDKLPDPKPVKSGDPAEPRPLVQETPRAAAVPTAQPAPTAQAAPVVQEAPALPVPALEAPPLRAQLRPELTAEPSHLALDEKEPKKSDRIEVPLFGKSDEPASGNAVPFEDRLAPFRIDPELFSQWLPSSGFLFGLTVRPYPNENDSESWPSPEGRLDGFLLVGSDGTRVPGLMLTLDLPFARDDSVLVSWTGALLPEPQGVEASMRPNWNHVTLGYTRRLAGYSSHATFDLAVSAGACADFFRAAQGIVDPGMHPKFAPYAGLDLSFWQHEPLGLTLHVGESVPITVVGSALGMTDVSGQIRWDLSQRVSLHGGYRMLVLRYKVDDSSIPAGAVALHDNLSGPILGVDIRF